MRKPLFYTAATLTLIASILFFLILLQKEVNHPKLPIYSQVENFQLMNSEGQVFGSNELKDKIWLVDFFFTSCSDICPMMSQQMSTLQKKLSGTELELVSISVNPDTDKPDVLAKYAKKYSSGTLKWHFLTGPIEVVQKLAVQSFKVGSIDEPVFHSDRLILVDRRGQIRGYYVGTDPQTLDQLVKDVASLLKEKKR